MVPETYVIEIGRVIEINPLLCLRILNFRDLVLNKFFFSFFLHCVSPRVPVITHLDRTSESPLVKRDSRDRGS